MCRVSTQITGSPLRQAPRLEADTLEGERLICQNPKDCPRLACHLDLAHHLARAVDDANTGLFHRHVQSCIVFHGCVSPLMLGAASCGPRSHHQPEAQPPVLPARRIGQPQYPIYRKLDSSAAMMEAGDDRLGHDMTEPFDRAANWRVLPEGEMRTRLVVVAGVRGHDPVEMCLAKHDHMVD